MTKLYYCPECKSKLEELSGCGAMGYFCNSCNKLISRKRILSEEDLTAYYEEALSKLAKFEKVYDDLLAKQEELTLELEKLKLEDKTKTTKFKQLLTNKMMNNTILILFKSYGLENE